MKRLVWLLLLLLAVGIGSWVSRGRDITSIVAAPEETAPADSGYVSVNAQLIETGEDGQPLFTLNAERIELARPDEPLLLTAPRLHYQPSADAAWSLTADEGTFLSRRQQLALRGNVVAQSELPQQESMSIHSEQLAVDLPAKRADSRDWVTLNWGPMRVTALGMRADLKDGSLRLESRGHAELAR